MFQLSQLRQPEYTGENRCIPCTAVNLGIAGVGSALVATKSKSAGVAAFAASVGLIHQRGYLIPKTPELTKRYLPDRVLRWFGKEQPQTLSTEIDIDPERVLVDAGVVESCQGGTDLCLTPDFRAEWRERAHSLNDRSSGDNERQLRAILGVPSQQVSFDSYGNALAATYNEELLAQWPSTAAINADLAAARELTEWSSNWDELTPVERGRVLTSLRIFIKRCPQCSGPVSVEQELVESCCRSFDVVVSSCGDCDAKLFEIEWDDTNRPTDTPDQEPEMVSTT